MILTTTQLKNILKAGGSLIVDASNFDWRHIEELASAAASHGTARLTLKNLRTVSPAHLIALSALAPGQIEFDLSPLVPAGTRGASS